jgi:hypothetical protein
MLDLEVALLTALRESNHFPAIIHMGLNQYMYIYVIYRKPLILWRYTGKWPIHLEHTPLLQTHGGSNNTEFGGRTHATL